MSESTLDQIVSDLRSSGSKYFPQHSEVKAARVVGHTPKSDHYTYEIVLDFSDGSERVNAKIYRAKNGSRSPQQSALREAQNLHFAHDTAQRRALDGVPRPIGDFADWGAVISTKVNGLPLQSLIMKAALLPGDGNHQLLETAARRAGQWLQRFHRASAAMPAAFDGTGLLGEIETLCAKGQKDGLPPESTKVILGKARAALARQKRPLRSSAILHDFIPLNVFWLRSKCWRNIPSATATSPPRYRMHSSKPMA